MNSSKKTIGIIELNNEFIVELRGGVFGRYTRKTFDNEGDMLHYLGGIESLYDFELNMAPHLLERFTSTPGEPSEQVMHQLAEHIMGKLGEKYGFCLLVYENDTSEGRLNYISNSQREDVIKAMREFIEKTAGSWGTHTE